jgi:hypothetical protein
MKHTLLFVSCLSLSLSVAAGCGSTGGPTSSVHSGSTFAHGKSANGDCLSGYARGDDPDNASAPRATLRGAAVGNYNKGYVDGVSAAAFFNKGRPMTDEQVGRLIAIGRRQGDPTGLLGLSGYPDGYRAGAMHSSNPYAKQMTGDQVAQVRKARGLPPQGRESAEASAR